MKIEVIQRLKYRQLPECRLQCFVNGWIINHNGLRTFIVPICNFDTILTVCNDFKTETVKTAEN